MRFSIGRFLVESCPDISHTVIFFLLQDKLSCLFQFRCKFVFTTSCFFFFSFSSHLLNSGKIIPKTLCSSTPQPHFHNPDSRPDFLFLTPRVSFFSPYDEYVAVKEMIKCCNIAGSCGGSHRERVTSAFTPDSQRTKPAAAL